MDTLFLICAGLGGTLILLQFVASVLGLGGDGHSDSLGHHDISSDSHEADDGQSTTDWFLGFLTFRAVTASIAFFGLGGLVAGYYQLERTAQMASAALSGIGTLYLVASVMKLFDRLRADGTLKISRAMGRDGIVYLRIPGRRSGSGKITLNLQNRTVELEAMTAEDEIPTGAAVRVVSVLGPTRVEVAAVTPEV